MKFPKLIAPARVGINGRELADLEFDRITVIAWPLLATIFCIEALTSQPTVDAWQIYFVVITVVALVVSIVLSRRLGSPIGYSVISVELLFAPIILNQHPVNPFMSYGLISLAVVVYLSGLDRPWIALPLMIGVVVLQIWVVHQDFTAINDKNDLLLLGTYFSTTWTLGLGIFSTYLRRRYLQYSDAIDVVLEEYSENATRKIAGVNLLNQSDHRNLKLHGTLLNTLIAVKMKSSKSLSAPEISEYLKRDVELLRSDFALPEQNLVRNIQEVCSHYSDSQLKVSYEQGQNLTVSELEANQILEITRELILNTKKHTHATWLTVTFAKSEPSRFRIIVRTNSLLSLSESDVAEEIAGVSTSRSLNRLMDAVDARLSAEQEESGVLRIGVEIGGEIGVIPPIEQLRTIRVESATWLSRGFLAATYAYGLICLLGFFLIPRPSIAFAIYAIDVLFMTLLYYRAEAFKYLLLPTIALALAVFPATVFGSPDCSELRFTPWVYNVLIGTFFYFALVLKNRILRWIPLFIYFIESIVIGHFYPAPCSAILNGSIPGVPIIALFVLAVSALRKSAIDLDESRLLGIYTSESDFEEISELITSSVDRLLEDVENFAQRLDSGLLAQGAMEDRINSLIVKIRLYLVMSESFSSEFIRTLYSRINAANVQLSLLGNNFTHVANTDPILNVVTQAIEISGDTQVIVELESKRVLSARIGGAKLDNATQLNLQGLEKGSAFTISYL